MRLLLLLLLTSSSAFAAVTIQYSDLVTVNAPPNYSVGTILAVSPPSLTTGWTNTLPDNLLYVLNITFAQWSVQCSTSKSTCVFPNYLGRPGSAQGDSFSFYVQPPNSNAYYVDAAANVYVTPCTMPLASMSSPCVPGSSTLLSPSPTDYPYANVLRLSLVMTTVLFVALQWCVVVVFFDQKLWRTRVVGALVLLSMFVALLCVAQYTNVRAEPREPRMLAVSGATQAMANVQLRLQTAQLLQSQSSLYNLTQIIPTHTLTTGALNEIYLLAAYDTPTNSTVSTLAQRQQRRTVLQNQIPLLEQQFNQVAVAVTSADNAVKSALAPLPSKATVSDRIAAGYALYNATAALLSALEEIVTTDLAYNQTVACPLGQFGVNPPNDCQLCTCPYYACNRQTGVCASTPSSSSSSSLCDPFRGQPVPDQQACNATTPCASGFVGQYCDTVVTCNTQNALPPLPQYPNDAPTCLNGCKPQFSGPNCETYVPDALWPVPAQQCDFGGEVFGGACCTAACDPTFFVCTMDSTCEFRDWSAWQPVSPAEADCAPCQAPTTPNAAYVNVTVVAAANGVQLSAPVQCALPVTAAQAACAAGGFPSQNPNWPLLDVLMVPSVPVQYSRGIFQPLTFVAAPANQVIPGAKAGSGAGETIVQE